MRFPATRATPRVAPLLFTVRCEIPSIGAGPLSSSSMKFSSSDCIPYLPARAFMVRSLWGRLERDALFGLPGDRFGPHDLLDLVNV